MRKKMFKYALLIIATAILTGSTAIAIADEKTDKSNENELACTQSKTMEKILNEKGYHHLLDMSQDKVTESLWIGGKSMIATAQVPDKPDISCLLSTFKDVTLNPVTITSIYEVLQKSQKGI